MPSNYLIFKQWLKRQLAVWQTCALTAEAKQRWPSLYLAEPVLWTNADFNAIDFGQGVRIGAFTEILAGTLLSESKIPGGLRVGDYTCIGTGGNIRAVGGQIIIGRDCLIAQQVSLIASNHNARAGEVYARSGWDETRTGVTIGDNVWIGCGVTVLPGCHIGNGAVIGAGSVVTKDIPANTIWAGIPARQKRVVGELTNRD